MLSFRYNRAMSTGTLFTASLLVWYSQHGRTDLPWQRSRDPYRVWVSEIMLQQTQVTTVIPYYLRFVSAFPDIQALARAEQDSVLHHWTGLGYYSRARHLHAAARQVCEHHGGCLPDDLAALCALPGIGRSTASAILAFAHGQRQPILDGNVKRVLARYHRVDGYPGARATETLLWEWADRHTPSEQIADYTQAIMDLGATVCKRRPRCTVCPVTAGCAAYRDGVTTDYPAPKPRRIRPQKSIAMLLIRDESGQILLEKRPDQGIWGGLWSLPECEVDVDIATWCERRLALSVIVETPWPPIRHSFSHYHLDITPVPARKRGDLPMLMEQTDRVWYNPANPDNRGLAAPVKRFIEALRIAS